MPQSFDHYVSPSRRRVRSAVRRRDRASIEPVISRKSVAPMTGKRAGWTSPYG